MQAHVTVEKIISSELRLLEGIHCDLMCFHPYKTLIGYSEDLRTYLKSKDGRAAVISSTSSSSNRGKGNPSVVVSGEDLRPIHNDARRIVDDACVSEIPLLHTPGQIGLAAMILANEKVDKARAEALVDEFGEEKKKDDKASFPRIDLHTYVKNRFKGRTAEEHEALEKQMEALIDMLRLLRQGEYELDISALKAVHKKLKKCKAWGESEEAKGEKTKKKKKRKADEDVAEDPPPEKVAKVSSAE